MFVVDFILKEADDSIILLDNRSQHGDNVSCKSDQYDHQYDDDPHGKPHPFMHKIFLSIQHYHLVFHKTTFLFKRRLILWIGLNLFRRRFNHWHGQLL